MQFLRQNKHINAHQTRQYFFWEKYVGIGDGKKIIKLQMHIFAQHSSKAITYVYAYMFVLLNQFYCWFTSFFDAVVLDGCGVGLICTHNISLGHWLRFTLTNVAKFLSLFFIVSCLCCVSMFYVLTNEMHQHFQWLIWDIL